MQVLSNQCGSFTGLEILSMGKRSTNGRQTRHIINKLSVPNYLSPNPELSL